MPAPIIVFLHDARHDRVHQAVSLVATATRMGRKAHLCLFYDALASYVRGSWDDTSTLRADDADRWPWRATLERNLELGDSPSLYEMLDGARRAGAGLLACTTSTRLLDLDPADVTARVDAIVGLASMLELAGDDGQIIYI